MNMSKEVEMQAIIDNLRYEVAALQFEIKKLKEALALYSKSE